MVGCGQWIHTRSTKKTGCRESKGPRTHRDGQQSLPINTTKSRNGSVDPLPLMSHSTLWVKYPWIEEQCIPCLLSSCDIRHSSTEKPGPFPLNPPLFSISKLCNKLTLKIFFIYLGYGNSQGMQVKVRWQPKVLASHHVFWVLNIGGQVWQQVPFIQWAILPAWQSGIL